MNICFVGGKTVGILGALSILSLGHNISGAVSYSDDLTDMLRLLGIRTFSSIKDKGLEGLVEKCDVILCVHGKEIFKENLLKHTCINIHPFFLRHKGSDPIGRALKNKTQEGDVASHYMIQEIDCGEVIHIEHCDVSGLKTYDEVYNRLYPLYIKTILKTFQDKIKCNPNKGIRTK